MTVQQFDKGPDFSGGPEGPDRSLLAHCLALFQNERTFNGYSKTGEWAVEFGTGSGQTTRMIAEVMPVISFDSFQGLPEDWRPDFPAGKFSHFEMPTDIVGATIVPGWFSDTVPNYDWPEWIGLAHFDADLYSSTSIALRAVRNSLTTGAILIFDEFFGYEGSEKHEERAFCEFIAETGYDYEVIGHGREQWAVRLV